MDTQTPGLAEAAGEAVEAATPQDDQQHESQQIETAEVDQQEAENNTQDEGNSGESDQQVAEASETESKSQRQRRLKRERQAERNQRLEANRKRLEVIEKQRAELKDPAFDEIDDPDRRTAVMAGNEARRAMLDADKDRIIADIQAAQAEAEREWREKSASAEVEARQRYTDYDAKVSVLTAVTQGRPNRAIQDALRASDNPADLAYWLGNNPEDAARINSLPDLQAAREIGRIEAGLSIPQPKKKTNAPPPIKPINQGAVDVVKNPEDMTFREYEAARKAGKL